MSKKALGFGFMAVAGLAAWDMLGSVIFHFMAHVPFSYFLMPWAAWTWWGDVFVMHVLKFAAGIPGAAVALGLIAVIVKMQQNALPLHGETHWATERDLRRNRLRGERGLTFWQRLLGKVSGKTHNSAGEIILGWANGELIRLDGAGSAAAYAEPRSGKTTSLGVTNAMLFAGSILAVDIRGDIHDASAGVREAHGQKVVTFDPLNPEGRTHCYNPFDYVRSGTPDAYTDVKNIANMLIPAGEGEQAFWNGSARMAFSAMAMFLSETPKAKFTIGAVVRILTQEDGPKRVREAIDAASRSRTRKPYTQNTVALVNDYIGAPPNTRDSIRKTVTTYCGSWLNPRIDTATSKSDFDLREVRSKLHAIYICINPIDLKEVQPIVALLIQQMVTLNMPRKTDKRRPPKYPLLMILDEFPQMGAMTMLKDAFAWLGGYGMRALIILQSKEQLEEPYGRFGAATVLKNCPTHVVFGTSDYVHATDISNRVGFNTEEVVSTSTGRGGRSTTRSKQKRALLLPQDVMRLPEDEQIIITTGCPPIKSQKIRPWLQRPFADLYMDPPPVPQIELPIRLLGGDAPAPAPQHEPPVQEALQAAAAASEKPKPGQTSLFPEAESNRFIEGLLKRKVDLASLSPDEMTGVVKEVVGVAPTRDRLAAKPPRRAKP